MARRSRPSSWPASPPPRAPRWPPAWAVNAGHDLNRDNLTDFLRAVPGVQEVSIGHALIADALELGLPETVRDYQRCIHRAQACRP
jgi:hypothetical protein